MASSSKRPRLASAVKEAGLGTSIAAVRRILAESGCDNEYTSVVGDYVSGWSGGPYGPVLRDIELPCVDGGTLVWSIAVPFALLWHLALASTSFARFMCTHLRDKTSSLVCWGDETTPGNQMRPDSSTSRLLLHMGRFSRVVSQQRSWVVPDWTLGV